MTFWHAMLIAARVICPTFVAVMLWVASDSLVRHEWFGLATQVVALAINLKTGFEAWFKWKWNEH